jgi:hypothetical protein
MRQPAAKLSVSVPGKREGPCEGECVGPPGEHIQEQYFVYIV